MPAVPHDLVLVEPSGIYPRPFPRPFLFLCRQHSWPAFRSSSRTLTPALASRSSAPHINYDTHFSSGFFPQVQCRKTSNLADFPPLNQKPIRLSITGLELAGSLATLFHRLLYISPSHHSNWHQLTLSRKVYFAAADSLDIHESSSYLLCSAR